MKYRLGLATVVLALSACGSNDDWQFKTTNDQVSNTSTVEALKTVTGQYGTYEVHASCRSGKRFNWWISTFDGDMQPLAINKKAGASVFRIDGQDQIMPLAVWGENVLKPMSDSNFIAVGHAAKLFVRIATPNGPDSFEVDQSNADFIAAIKPCLDNIAEKAARKALKQEQETQAQAAADQAEAQPAADSAEEEQPILRADEIAEIEAATGREYQPGDSIHGRAEDIH